MTILEAQKVETKTEQKAEQKAEAQQPSTEKKEDGKKEEDSDEDVPDLENAEGKEGEGLYMIITKFFLLDLIVIKITSSLMWCKIQQLSVCLEKC